MLFVVERAIVPHLTSMESVVALYCNSRLSNQSQFGTQCPVSRTHDRDTNVSLLSNNDAKYGHRRTQQSHGIIPWDVYTSAYVMALRKSLAGSREKCQTSVIACEVAVHIYIPLAVC